MRPSSSIEFQLKSWNRFEELKNHKKKFVAWSRDLENLSANYFILIIIILIIEELIYVE